MAKYFHELTLEEMFEHHDHTYMMADDHRAYENGRREAEIIVDKVKSEGGWTKELCDLYNLFGDAIETRDHKGNVLPNYLKNKYDRNGMWNEKVYKWKK